MYCNSFIKNFVEKVADNFEYFMVVKTTHQEAKVIGFYNSIDLAIQQICMCVTRKNSIPECFQKLHDYWSNGDGETQRFRYKFFRYEITSLKMNEMYDAKNKIKQRHPCYLLSPKPGFCSNNPFIMIFVLVCRDCDGFSLKKCTYHNPKFHYESEFLTQWNKQVLILSV